MTAKNAPRTGPITIISLVILVGIFGYFLYQNLHRLHDQNELKDFRCFYMAAKEMSAGRDIYKLVVDEYYVYPPMLAFLLLPLTHFSAPTAASFALVLNISVAIVAVAGATLEMARRFKVPKDRFLPALAIVLVTLLSMGRLKAELQMMQTDVLILGAFVLALIWLDRRPWTAGAILGFALNIKYLTIGVLPYLLLRRRWNAATAFIISSLFWALLPSLKVGLHTDLQYLRSATNGLATSVGLGQARPGDATVHKITDGLSVSVSSGIARRFRNHGWSESMSHLATAGVLATWTGLAVVIYRRNRVPVLCWPKAGAQSASPFVGLVALEWVGLIVATLAFSPDTNTRHLVLLVVFNALGVVLLLTPIAPKDWVYPAAALGLLLLALESGIWANRGLTSQWINYSGQGWVMLIAYLILLSAGLRRITSSLEYSARAGATVP